MKLSPLTRFSLLCGIVQSSLAHLPSERRSDVEERAVGTKYVFAHFMVGVVASYSQNDWATDIAAAQTIGIDGFALNIGKDPYNDQQLGYAYAAAAAANFKVFISFDFAYWNGGDVSTIANYIGRYGNQAAQFKYNNAIFVSSFIGDGFNWRGVESQSGMKLFSCPNWQTGSLSSANADCGFSWDAWPSSNNQPINQNKTTASDNAYIGALGSKPYMMPVSPWFYTHYGQDTYNKNWIFLSDWLWAQRWQQALQLAPQFLQIITWNDFGESHYIGPLHPTNPSVYAGGNNGAMKWVTGMPHDGWRDIAAPYITAYKAGVTTPIIQVETLVYYYRPNFKDTSCSDSVAKPTGYQYVADQVFVTAMLKSEGIVQIQSGFNAMNFTLPAGVTTVQIPMGMGSQTFSLIRGTRTVLKQKSALDITASCGVQPFNAYVGSIRSSGIGF